MEGHLWLVLLCIAVARCPKNLFIIFITFWHFVLIDRLIVSQKERDNTHALTGGDSGETLAAATHLHLSYLPQLSEEDNRQFSHCPGTSRGGDLRIECGRPWMTDVGGGGQWWWLGER
jgi:hypothetical protein